MMAEKEAPNSQSGEESSHLLVTGATRASDSEDSFHDCSGDRVEVEDSGVDLTSRDCNGGAEPGASGSSESGVSMNTSNTVEEESEMSTKRRCSDSSSSTTSGPDDVEDVELMNHESEDEDDGYNVPIDTWKPFYEVRQREFGFYRPQQPMSYLFQRHSMSSIGLVQRFHQEFTLEKHEGCVNSLNFNKSGTLLASGSDDLNVILWKWNESKPYLVYESGHRSNVFQSKFMPFSGDCHVVSCARDGQVRLAELSSTGVCKNTKKLAQHKAAAHKLATLHDSSHVVLSCGEDAVTYEIDLRQEKPNKLCVTKENNKKISLYSIHCHPFNSNEFCVGGIDHFIRIYDRRRISMTEDSGTLKKFVPHHLINDDHKANVTCAVYNYNGSEVLGTYNDDDIYLFNTEHSDGADFIKRYKGHRNNATVKGVNFYGPKSEFVVSGSDCGNVFLWDKETENIVNYFHADDGGVTNVLEPHPHAPILATSGLDHEIKIFTPTAPEATKLRGLNKRAKTNVKEREHERINEPEMIDGRMLWVLMQHLRRSARRERRDHGGDDAFTSSSEDSDDSEPDSDVPESMQECVPS